MQPCENAELLSCSGCLRTYCVVLEPNTTEGSNGPVFCSLGHDAVLLVPAEQDVSDCVRVLRVGLRYPGSQGNRTYSVVEPAELIRADS